jgi:hypothetical protein
VGPSDRLFRLKSGCQRPREIRQKHQLVIAEMRESVTGAVHRSSGNSCVPVVGVVRVLDLRVQDVDVVSGDE